MLEAEVDGFCVGPKGEQAPVQDAVWEAFHRKVAEGKEWCLGSLVIGEHRSCFFLVQPERHVDAGGDLDRLDAVVLCPQLGRDKDANVPEVAAGRHALLFLHLFEELLVLLLKGGGVLRSEQRVHPLAELEGALGMALLLRLHLMGAGECSVFRFFWGDSEAVVLVFPLPTKKRFFGGRRGRR